MGGRDEVMPLWRNWLEPRKLPENAASPTCRVHAMLAAVLDRDLAIGKLNTIFLTVEIDHFNVV